MFLIATPLAVHHIAQVEAYQTGMSQCGISSCFYSFLAGLALHLACVFLVLSPNGHFANLFGFGKEKNGIRQLLIADGCLDIARFGYGSRIKLVAHVPVTPIVGTRPMVIVRMNEGFPDRHMILGRCDDACFLRIDHGSHRQQGYYQKYNFLHNLCFFVGKNNKNPSFRKILQ